MFGQSSGTALSLTIRSRIQLSWEPLPKLQLLQDASHVAVLADLGNVSLPLAGAEFHVHLIVQAVRKPPGML
jgi:hypothetical protein